MTNTKRGCAQCANKGSIMLNKLSPFIFLLVFSSVNADLQQKKIDILDKLLAKYDPEYKPSNGTDTPTTVTISLHVLSISQIDDHKMLYTLELYFRQEWKDVRLQYEDVEDKYNFIVLNDQHRIWVPDIFFPNEHKSYFHDIMESNSFVKILPDGTVQTSARITLLLRCPMTFVKFPFDKQVCSLDIESYKWQADDIIVEWKNETPVTVGDEFLSPMFTLEKFWTEGGLIEFNGGEYSVLRLKFKFSRQVRLFLIQVYIPCCMIFIASCLTFWLNSKLMTARIVLGTTSLFAMALFLFHFNTQYPTVPYTRAIDIFTGLALTFVFASLVETIFVHLSETKIVKAESKSITCKEDSEQGEKVFEKRHTLLQMKEWLFENHKTLNDIDAACRVLFPLCFVIFIVIYSITCASIKDT